MAHQKVPFKALELKEKKDCVSLVKEILLMLLEMFIGRKVKVIVAFGSWGTHVSREIKGVLTKYNDEAIILNDSIYISRGYLTVIELI